MKIMPLPTRSAQNRPALAPARTRREQAIDAAAQVFARFGYHGAGTRTIADVLGIKVATLYSHFSSKDDALEQVCRVGIERPYAYLHMACEQESDAEARVRLFFAAHQAHLRENGDYVSVYMNERRYLPPEAKTRLNAFSRAVNAEIDRIFADAQAQGLLNPELTPRLARLILIGALRNITQFSLEGPIGDFDRFVDVTVNHLLRGLLGQAPTDPRES